MNIELYEYKLLSLFSVAYMYMLLGLTILY